MTPRSLIHIAFLAVLMSEFGGVGAAGQLDPIVLRSLREDATLRDVQFVDEQRGWAVGDRGTIWHTDDGGRAWRLQESGVECGLNCVWFVNELIGWAGGTEFQAYTPSSTGVLLHTRDGGKSWQRDPGLLLPGLRGLKFFNSQQGWAWGETSTLFPSGLLVTDDGGRTWAPIAMSSSHNGAAADFLDPQTGITVGAWGRGASLRQRRFEPTTIASLGLRVATRLKIAALDQAWLVGSGSLLFHSRDQGRDWRSPENLPDILTPECDLRAIEARGASVWVAGSPGARIAVSHDHGASWQSFRTGQPLPIEDLAFVDEQRGWAVGALGMILSTNDGGRTWRRQRNFSPRVALLGLFSDLSSTPLELLAKLSGNDGYLSTVALLNRRDVDPGCESFATQSHRATATLAACGAGSLEAAWRFPLKEPGVPRSAAQWLADWDRTNEGQAMARFEAHLVRQVRQWRPDVVVTHAATLRGDDPLGHTISQLALRAVEQAADATCYPEQLSLLGLEPWRVRKVFGKMPEGKLGSVNLTTATLAPRLGGSLSEATQVVRGWLNRPFEPAPAAIGFQSLIDTLPPGAGQSDFFSGINLSPGGEGRRLLADMTDATAELLKRQAQKQRHLQAILTQHDRQQRDSARLLAELGQLTTGLDTRAAGELLYSLSHHYARQGEWQLAAETLQLFVSRHADHALARAALTELLQMYTSHEIAWQWHHRSGAPPHLEWLTGRAEQACQIASQLKHQHALWFTEPQVQFPFAAALRQRGAEREAEQLLLTLARSRGDDPWRDAAHAEIALLSPTHGSLSTSMNRIGRTPVKPRLDGALDEPLWAAARPCELRSPTDDDAAWPALVLLSYDDEFLYLAASCRRAKPSPPSPPHESRPRDPDLTQHDRVELLFDVDRDRATFFRLTIDERGWARDECAGDTTWNPQWFIAAGGDNQTWTFEAAIAWSEWSEKPPTAQTAWGLQLQRLVPEAGFQAWTQPANPTIVPAGFGYVVFE